MKTIRQWIEIDPLDTLFFKSSEPMVAGQNHEVKTVFPPMPTTLMGAIRTAILLQRDVLSEFLQTGAPPEAHPILGAPESPGFEVTGPLFAWGEKKTDHEFFFPAPALWFGNVKKAEDGEAVVIRAGRTVEKESQKLGLKGSVATPVWRNDGNEADVKPLTGFWANPAAFSAVADGKSEIILKTELTHLKPRTPYILPLSAFHQTEERVGIALDAEAGNRRVRPGHLYSTTHVRLTPGVRLWVGISETAAPDHLDPVGTFPLGGEQRLVRYQARTDEVSPPAEAKTPWAMSLAPIPCSRLEVWGWAEWPRVSGPLIRMGGWDMKKGFHKPMTAFYPAGTTIRVGDAELPFGFIRI